MHLYLVTRGITYEVQKFVDIMQSNLVPYPTDSKKPWKVQVSMRPVQLWECVFPKAVLPNVLKGLKYVSGKQKYMNAQNIAMRKILKAKKIPDLDLKKTPPINCYLDNVAVYPIGIKDDTGIWANGKWKGGERL